MKRIFLVVAALLFSASALQAQQYSLLSPLLPFVDGNGNPLSGGLVYTCTTGSTCPGTAQASYSDTSGTANANPVVLDSGGWATIYLSTTACYKIVVRTSAGVAVRSQDAVCANLTAGFISGSIVGTTDTQTLTNKTLGNTNTVTLKDTKFTLQDDGDTTKQVVFQASGLTTGNTRTLTVPDASITLLGRAEAATVQNKTLDNTNIHTMRDDRLTLQDDADTTKQVIFQLSGITTATTRTYAFPDASTTFVGTDATQTLTNKTLTSPGISVTGRARICSVPVGSVSYATFGNATTYANGDIWYIDVFIPVNKTLTGLSILNAGTVGTDKVIVGLYDSAGTKLIGSAAAGAITVGANAFQDVAFTATYAATGPARYWVAVQGNGATDNFRTVATGTFVDVLTKNETGVFGTMPTFVPPTNFVANDGPVACIY